MSVEINPSLEWALKDPCRSKDEVRDDGNSEDQFIDEAAAAKSLALYCKPVELYNTLRDRFKHQPVFLQRCLNYKIQALRPKRLQVALQVQGLVNMPPLLQWKSCRDYIDLHSSTASSHPSLPIFVMVINQPPSPQGIFSLSKVYKVARVPLRGDGALSAPVTFLLPQLAKLLVHAKNRHFILFFAFVDPQDVFDTTRQQIRDLVNCSGNVLWSKLSMTSLCMQWLWNANWAASPSGIHSPFFQADCTLDFWPGKLQYFDKVLGLMNRVRPLPGESRTSLRRSEMRLQGRICAEEIGHNMILNEPTSNGTSQELSSPLPLRNSRGRVEFHYLYYFNRCEKIEVMERYSCPFCLTRCHTFKGLQCHLSCTHDLFHFEYLLTADVPAVNVTCRTELLDPEGAILQESKLDLKTKIWMFGLHRRGTKAVVSHGQDHGEKRVFTGPPVAENRHCSKKRAVKGAERKGSSVYRNAQGQSPAKRKKVGATFHEEIHSGALSA